MIKPEGYDEAKIGGSFNRITAGTHTVRILKVEDVKSSNDRAMIVLSLDVCQGEFKDYYKNKYNYVEENYGGAKWGCILKQVYDGNSASYFKGMITAIEKSNQGYNYKNSGYDETTLKGKIACGVFDYGDPWKNDDGEMVRTIKILLLRSLDMLGKITPKAKQEIKPPFANKSYGEAPPTGFEDDNSDELPF